MLLSETAGGRDAGVRIGRWKRCCCQKRQVEEMLLSETAGGRDAVVRNSGRASVGTPCGLNLRLNLTPTLGQGRTSAYPGPNLNLRPRTMPHLGLP